MEILSVDEVLNIDFEQHLLTEEENVVFAVMTDDYAAIFWSVCEVSNEITQITDELVLCEVDGITILLFDAKTTCFLFTRAAKAEEADEIVNSLL